MLWIAFNVLLYLSNSPTFNILKQPKLRPHTNRKRLTYSTDTRKHQIWRYTCTCDTPSTDLTSKLNNSSWSFSCLLRLPNTFRAYLWIALSSGRIWAVYYVHDVTWLVWSIWSTARGILDQLKQTTNLHCCDTLRWWLKSFYYRTIYPFNARLFVPATMDWLGPPNSNNRGVMCEPATRLGWVQWFFVDESPCWLMESAVWQSMPPRRTVKKMCQYGVKAQWLKCVASGPCQQGGWLTKTPDATIVSVVYLVLLAMIRVVALSVCIAELVLDAIRIFARHPGYRVLVRVACLLAVLATLF